MKLLSGLLDLFFPPRRVCPLCGAPEDPAGICGRCREAISFFRREPFCSMCGRFFQQTPGVRAGPQRDGERLCRDCAREGRFFQLSRAAGPYEGFLKGAVLRLKYTGKRELAGHLAELMFQSAALNQYYISAQLITPVPLSLERSRRRGFNQSELLAFELARRMRLDMLAVLRKTRETSPQTGLGRYGRGENLVGAFGLTDPVSVRGKAVLLVDDVVTTGNTLNNASETLIRGGAATVVCIAAAAGRTLPHSPCGDILIPNRG